MIRINLRPPFEPPPNSTILYIDMGIAVFLLLVTYAANVYLAQKSESEAAEIQAVTSQKQQELTNVQSNIRKQDALKVKLQDLNMRKQSIMSLTKGRQRPVIVFDTLQQIHSSRLWINHLNFSQDKVTISGFAAEYQVISEYVQRLKAVNSRDIENLSDFKNFTPDFSSDPHFSELDAPLKESDLLKAHFTQVALKESLKEENKDLGTVYKFTIEFSPNLR